MTMTKEQMTERIVGYMSTSMLPNASTVGKFKIGFAMPLVPQMVDQYWEMGRGLGIVDDSGVDTERLGECIESGFRHAGELTIGGFRFMRADAEEFVSQIRR